MAIIEIKYSLKEDDLKEDLPNAFRKIETFKTSFPKYANYKYYLGFASLSFKQPVEDIIAKEGIAVIKQVGNKMVINSDSLRVF